ncbi:HK97-gp10 family putative phage morphogenesis protein [Pontivivens nitratireducens]|uniref:HK97-gp10 family putative phage morphogenesis protein n=1 Tax=Pontivivens nitratireducens TaxID=2758038 RepID=UPI00163ADB7B|nr:HK97-gp10 family putative phage morphogenesis protein [Pontibrevibacter nitratireducens]
MGRGLASYQRRMRAIRVNGSKSVQPALLKGAQDIADTIEALTPEDTGDLKNSVTVTRPGGVTPPYSQPGGQTALAPNQAAVTVGSSDVRYPHLVEYGTATSPAQPFFWPGYRLSRAKAMRRIKAAIGKAVRDTR